MAPPLTARASGSLVLAGLSAPARVVRDRFGVPHIYARNRDDVFAAQGFVQAQDRLFQMDLWRRSAQGRLAQVFGANFIERDAMTRRVQYAGDLESEWASYGPDAKAIAVAFVRGINAWVALARERPPEEFVLAGWKPEFWSPVDLLNRTDAFVQGRTPVDESTTAGSLVADAIRRVGTPPFFIGLEAPVPTGRAVVPAGRAAIADSGLHLDHPSRRYLVHLNAPGWNMIGATAPWLPGVAVGHDERVAWDIAQADAGSPSVEAVKTNPDNPHQVDDGGRWVDTVIVKDAVVVKGRREPFAYETELTNQGVIVATDRERHLAFAVRWRGLQAGAMSALRVLATDRAAAAARVRLRSDARRTDPTVSAPSLEDESANVLFAHPLAITAGARSRFNVGPLPKPTHELAAFAVSFDLADWDRSSAMNAPGQAESPDSAHFADLAALWEAGTPFPLAFTDRAVASVAEATLTLVPADNGSQAPPAP